MKLEDEVISNDRIAVNYDSKFSYYIYLKEDFLYLKEEFVRLGCENRKVCIVTESTVGPLYANQVEEVLLDVAQSVYVYTFQAGEKSKNLATVEKLYEFLIDHSFDRNDVLVALGGGVVGDLTGFAASTYLRGIRFIQVPTSLLAMVDSSIGGKTGVDFNAYKNMVGAFYMPKCVYMNLNCLMTLQEKEFYSGFGEIIKHGLIKNISYYEWLKLNVDAIQKKDLSFLKEMVYQSCLIKRGVVERDPKEQGERALLNFGHTLGHAVEKLKEFQLLHGECVSIGIVLASYISLLRGYLDKNQYEDIINTLELYHLPTSVEDIDVNEILEVASHDKKMDGKKVKFILLEKMGNAIIDSSVSNEEMELSIKQNVNLRLEQ